MNFKWTFQSFDTDFFGFKTAKIMDVTTNAVPDLLQDLKRNKINYASYRLLANKFSIIHDLEKNGFILVDGTIALELNNYETENKKFSKIRNATKDDISALRKIARTIFINTRFYADPVIPRRKAGELYAKWIENSVLGKAADEVLVWEENSKLLGFVTLQKSGHIVLIGVNKSTQGKGIGRILIEASLPYFKRWKAQTVFLETQTTNIPAIRSYQSCGFKIVDSFLTFRWTDL